MAEKLFDSVCIIIFERDHILLGLLYDTLSAITHNHRGERATRAHLEGTVSSTQLAEILVLNADNEFMYFNSRPSLSLRVRSLYSALLYHRKMELPLLLGRLCGMDAGRE